MAATEEPTRVRDAFRRAASLSVATTALVRQPARLRELAGRSLPGLADPKSRQIDLPRPHKRLVAGSGNGPPWWLISFGLLVGLPTLATLLYFLLAAAPQFVSEMRFVARGAIERLEMEGIGRVRALSSLNNSQEAHMVADYIGSRAMVEDLAREHDLRAMFSRPRWDFIAGFDEDGSVGDLTEYWRDMVDVHVDMTSGVVTVRIYAFRPEDAQALAEGVLARSEAFVNRISEHMRLDRVGQARSDVREARAELSRLLTAIEASRNRQSIVSAMQLGSALEELAAELRDERATLASARAAAAARLDADAPSVMLLNEQLRSLDEQRREIDAAIAARQGDGESLDLTRAISLFDLYEIRRDLATQRLSRAETALTEARLEVLRQQVYLDVFMPPTLAEEARHPKSLLATIAVFAAFSAVWGIGCLYLTGIRERAC